MCVPLFSKLVSLAELTLLVVSCEGTVLLLHLFCCQGEGGERERGRLLMSILFTNNHGNHCIFF